jgi:5,10-methylenetetrahydromethanopterin reductase
MAIDDVTFGVALPLDEPVEELVATARTAEELGYGFVWANDDRLQRDVFEVLASFALATERIHLGPGVTNPYSRHPALIATAIATLAELSGGRAVLGLGAGGTNHRALGIDRAAPAAALREAIELIRGLLAGREVTVEGRVIRAYEAELDFDPPAEPIPIYVGARGPRVLELAGELADGVIVGNVTTVEAWTYALDRVRAGAARAGRDPGGLRVTAWVYSCISDDPAEALTAVRPMVATSLVTSRATLPQLGVTMPPRFRAVMEELGWRLDRGAVEHAAHEVPDEVVHGFALAGAPGECRNRLDRLLARFPQISQVVVVPFAPPRQRRVDVVRRFMEEVVRQRQLQAAG